MTSTTSYWDRVAPSKRFTHPLDLGRLAAMSAARRAREADFVANPRSRASVDQHAAFGLERLERSFQSSGVTFAGGEGELSRADLTRSSGWRHRTP